MLFIRNDIPKKGEDKAKKLGTWEPCSWTYLEPIPNIFKKSKIQRQILEILVEVL